ncbi:MAG: hypothetical protein LQ350_008039 [Teloschistes chrysophthalmus]|nr:MAG: hypothetical protein LQ350_008039 [Niorma chrysophthalma]
MAPSPPPDHANPRTTSTPPPDGVTQIPGAERVQQFSELPSESSTVPRTLLIGTRASALALAQVDLFTSLLSPIHPNLPTKTVPISVAGDRDKTTNLHTLAQTGKSLWTEELEVLLLKGEIDCIVHSLKDVPTKVCEGCVVIIVGDRGERRDCVVFPSRENSVAENGGERVVSGGEASARLQQESDLLVTATKEPSDGTSDGDQPSPKKRKLSPSSTIIAAPPRKRLSDLPPNSIVGTSSVRRSAMIRRRYPHLRIQDVRGNVGTRLRKLDDPANGFDCLILAGAGIQRLGLGGRINEWLDPTVDSDEEAEGTYEANGEEGNSKFRRKGRMLHAVGQGAIGLEIREGDGWVSGLLEGREGSQGVVVNRVSWECQAERSLLRTLEGGCSVPVGVSCSWEEVVNTTSAVSPNSTSEINQNSSETSERTANIVPGTNDPPSHTHTVPLPLTSPSDLQMSGGTLHIHASVTSVDGTECVSTSRRQYVSNDQEADEAGWEVARCLVEDGAGKILEAIGLNRGMIERAGGA